MIIINARFFFGYLTITIFGEICVRSHPQCLDFEPPFNPTKPLNFCSVYQRYSCCSNLDDSRLSEKYHDIFARFNLANFRECSRYVRDILCASCDPYSAHVFQAESDPEDPLQFPGLCQTYCRQFFTKCRETLPYLTNDSRLLQPTVSTADEFCRRVSLKDADYCYPDLLRKNGPAGIRTEDAVATKRGDSDGRCLCVRPTADGLRNPVFGTFAGSKDRTLRFYVLEQLGLVHVYADGWRRLPRPFLDIRDRVFVTRREADERGLLGLAFHPNFDRNRVFYVYYVANTSAPASQSATPPTAVRISRFSAHADGMTGDASSERVLFELPKPNNWANHNGGMLMFGTDGMLYAFIGDGGGAGDLFNNAQNKSVLFGKAIRLDVSSPQVLGSGPELYKIPSNNPFVKDDSALPEIFAYGLRNAWRCSVDRGDALTGKDRGRIFCGDVGQDAYEEVDVVESGRNYGWRAKEGFVCYNKKECINLVGDTPPIHAYGHKDGKSVTGGYVYRGCQNANLKGSYVYGDYVNGQLFVLDNNGTAWENRNLNMCEERLCTNGLTNEYEKNILSFAEDYKGELYVLVTSTPSSQSREGKLYKLVDPQRKEDPTSCKYPSAVS